MDGKISNKKALPNWLHICIPSNNSLNLLIVILGYLMSTKVIQDTIANYFKTQPVLKAWLFGSYSRGEQRPWSDVDILVQYDRQHPIGLMKIAGMKVDLEDLLGCEVDLVEDGTLRPWALESVNRDRRLIYERA